MEAWFLYSLGGALLAGVASFLMKVAAHRKYNPELFILYAGLVSVLLVFFIMIFAVDISFFNWPIMLFSFFGGIIASMGGIFRVKALGYIDTTIYFPLLKLLSPSFAILFGVILLSESFSSLEWLGLVLGLFVPLLLINKIEKTRQNNLVLGLILTGLTGLISATVALINKYSVDIYGELLVLLLTASLGIFSGSILFIIYKQGYRKLVRHIINESNRGLVLWSVTRALFILLSFYYILKAFSLDGSLAVVHTIHSLYILIPIILSIIFYKEHWSLRKVFAIGLSVVALIFLG